MWHKKTVLHREKMLVKYKTVNSTPKIPYFCIIMYLHIATMRCNTERSKLRNFHEPTPKTENPSPQRSLCFQRSLPVRKNRRLGRRQFCTSPSSKGIRS